MKDIGTFTTDETLQILMHQRNSIIFTYFSINEVCREACSNADNSAYSLSLSHYSYLPVKLLHAIITFPIHQPAQDAQPIPSSS